MKRFFVTGTDTGAGKTFTTAALARRGVELGKRVCAFKPIETGCERIDGRLVGPDQELVAAAAGDWQTGPLRGLYRLVQPIAPLLAAKAEGVEIDLDLVARTATGIACDLLLVEGAGGWRVPVTSTEDMAGIPRRLDCPVIIVARATLGTINHSLLTIEAVEGDELRVAAVVLSRRPHDDRDFALSNADQIRRCWPGRVLVLDSDPSVLDDLV